MKQGQRVNYTTGTNAGTGRITGIRNTQKGAWYEVTDVSSGKVFVLRGARLTKI